MGWTANDLASRGAPPGFGDPTAYATPGGQNIVYQGFTLGEGGNGSLHLLQWDLFGWHYRGDFTTFGIGAPLADQFTDLASYYFPAENTSHIDYISTDGHVAELYFDSNGWNFNDLTTNTNAPVTALGGPSGFASGFFQQVFYRGHDLHVEEMFRDIDWHPRDLTATAGGPLVFTWPPTSYAFEGQSTQHVVYVGADPSSFVAGHIHELWRDSHGHWHDGGNLTTITGAPTLAQGEPSGYAFEEEFTQHVFYRGVDQDIHELRWGTDTGGWHYWGNLTTLTGAPKASGDPRGYVFVPQSTQHVVYTGVDNHIHEFWWDGAWHHNDLTQRTGAPAAGSDPIGYFFGDLGNKQHIVYNSDDHHIVELLWEPLATRPEFLADVTGDKRADIVAFGDEGVWVALGKGDGTFDFPQLAIPDFGYSAGGWRVDKHLRLIGDITGDGLADVVGFGDAGVYVSRAAGGGAFNQVQFVIADLGYDSGWRVDRHPRFLADLRNKGRADIVGFGDAGVYVALSNGDGSFTFTPIPVVTDFGYEAGSWRVDRHPRFLADLRGIGIADIVGFGDAGVWVALGDGQGGFGAPQFVVADFGYNQGWRVDRHPRFLADLSGNGRLDIVGFGDAGVYVARGRGDGTFDYTPVPVLQDLGYVAGGWRVDRHPRFLADVNGDGRADIVGFGDAGVYVALSNGDGTFTYTPVPVLAGFAYDAGGWRVERNPRFLADLRGVGRADIVGFYNVGVRTALSSTGGAFGAIRVAAPDFGYEVRGW